MPKASIKAAEHFVQGKRQTRLEERHIQQIVATYQGRTEQERYSRRVAEEETIVQHDCNLNISCYVSTATAEPGIDLAATHAELVRIERELARATATHNPFLKELGLAPLPIADAG